MLRIMEIDGYVYSQSQLRALVDGVQNVERGVSGVGSQYKTTMSDIRVAIGSDEYGETYWKSRSERLAAIDALRVPVRFHGNLPSYNCQVRIG
jgi:hypothetical protein